ncbi:MULTISPECIES: YggT family protein [unclassified Colwellia]|jgi:YggT family protein|uniref:YggT family protein n=1 Tax=unclassified Colwellia TaxID=196834 RepID=UPI0015F76AA7|nr:MULTISPECIES: YggT family protein [unclassified Colwellia]MBA6231723.1 YggT family protein [Colwellia sp. MB02u-7]MBA6235587.1 YggT family protein [Colwellia sp. MB02u-11]MBA6254900.1 YggT family protein [Colwellia sp. MB3u-28]MBA6259682.1 YggT family protein [Colwellia sp. MB3u-41]MBA6299575.1 YggT family protein [Colwellia sp. MB3u-22]
MEAINYLLSFAFDALLMLLVLRVWLQLVRADFYNPFSQFIVKVTNPVVIPLRRVIPGFGGIDVPTVLLAFIVASLKFILIPLINGADINIISALYLGLIYLIKQTGILLFMLMLVMALMSWVVQGYNPTQAIFQQLTEPFLKPIKRIVPSIGGLDLSVLIAFLLLNVINIFLSGSVPGWAVL